MPTDRNSLDGGHESCLALGCYKSQTQGNGDIAWSWSHATLDGWLSTALCYSSSRTNVMD